MNPTLPACLQGVNSLLASYARMPYHNFMEHTEMARMGGKARAEALTPERRKKIAKKAARARVAKMNGGTGPKPKVAK